MEVTSDKLGDVTGDVVVLASHFKGRFFTLVFKEAYEVLRHEASVNFNEITMLLREF